MNVRVEVTVVIIIQTVPTQTEATPVLASKATQEMEASATVYTTVFASYTPYFVNDL